MKPYWSSRGEFPGSLSHPPCVERSWIRSMRYIRESPKGAKSSVWWPGLRREIQNLVQQRRICASHRENKPEPLIATPLPDRSSPRAVNWNERLHENVTMALTAIYCRLCCSIYILEFDMLCLCSYLLRFFHWGKCQVSILFKLQFYCLQYREWGFKLYTYKCYYNDIVKGQFLFNKAFYNINYDVIRGILPPLHNRTHKTTLGGMGASVSQAHDTLY